MTWRQRARCASPKWKARRRRSCRPRASSPRPAPSRSPARARNMSERPGVRPQPSATIERWRLPEVDGPNIGRTREERRAAASEESTRLALKEAEARGYEAGMTRARTETAARLAALEERVKRLDAALGLLARPLEQLDADIESELAQLALGVGK